MKTYDGRTEAAVDAEAAAHRLAAIVESSDDAIVSKDLEGTITSWNRAAERLFGYEAGEIIGKPILTLIPSDRWSEENDILARIRRGDRVEHFETVRRRKDGSLVDVSLTISPILRADGSVAGASKIARDIGERKRSDAKLARQAEQLAALNRAAIVVSQDLDLDRIVQAVTDIATALSGARFGAFFYNVLDDSGESYLLFSLSGAPREAFENFGMPRNTMLFDATFRGEGIIRSDDIRRDPRYGQNPPHLGMPAGHLAVVSYLAVPVVSASGQVHGGLFFGHENEGVFDESVEGLVAGIAAHAAVAMDNARLHDEARREIEQRTRAEAATELLLHELQHRVKNTLAMVQAIASQTFLGAPAREREAFEDRVSALAAAHDLLTRHNWNKVSAVEVARRALRIFGEIRPGRIAADGPDAMLPAGKALLIAMALHELGTNAVKYGALSNDAGNVALRWETETRDAREWVNFSWTEAGGPPVVPPARRGFGSRMVERALRSERGEAEISFEPDGVQCRISLPL